MKLSLSYLNHNTEPNFLKFLADDYSDDGKLHWYEKKMKRVGFIPYVLVDEKPFYAVSLEKGLGKISELFLVRDNQDDFLNELVSTSQDVLLNIFSVNISHETIKQDQAYERGSFVEIFHYFGERTIDFIEASKTKYKSKGKSLVWLSLDKIKDIIEHTESRKRSVVKLQRDVTSVDVDFLNIILEIIGKRCDLFQ